MKWTPGRNKLRRSTRPRALVYRGPASAPGCPESVAELLASSPWKFDVAFTGPRERVQITPDTLRTAAVYAQPGGDDLDDAFRHLSRHTSDIQDYVRSGGRYLGFCLGGYLAGHTPGFDLFPGDADQYIASESVEIPDTESTVVDIDWHDRRTALYFQDGPYFWLDRHYRDYYDNDAVILGRYRNGEIAALAIDYGNGRVGVVGPHPEADETWYQDAGLAPPDALPTDVGFDLIDKVMSR